MKYYSRVQSPLGELLVTGEEGFLTGLYFDGFAHAAAIKADWKRDEVALAEVASQLHEYFSGRRQSFDLRINASGSEFQRQVWAKLAKLPFGTTTTYKAIADSLGRPAASRAVGTAIGKNPVCIIVPCHRVIASSGGMGGYAGGLQNKAWLLAHER